MKKNVKKNSGKFAFKTDIGRIRITNEDQALVKVNASGDVLLLVLDGMGGHNKGDYASRLALNHISDSFESKSHFFSDFTARLWLQNTVISANKYIYDQSCENETYKGMGSTIVCVLLRNDKLFMLNAGDSRAYLVTRNKLNLISEDQSYVSYLCRSGSITEEEAKIHPQKNLLLNALGIYPSLNFNLFTRKYNGEHIVLCSDGLYNNISDKEMHAILNSDERPDIKVDTLIRVANKNGGSDNIAIAYFERISHE